MIDPGLIPPISRLFKNTTTSYKFFWFLALLDSLDGEQWEFTLEELLAGMLAKVWYPVHYFKLSFGRQDKLASKAMELYRRDPLSFPVDISPQDLKEALLASKDKEIISLLTFFQAHVPYRFLSPWYHDRFDKKRVVSHSQSWGNHFLYALDFPLPNSITINPIWREYLSSHQYLLKEYTYWQLLLYLQRRNPNVPGIANKLIKPQRRNSLSIQRSLWNLYISENDGLRCLYSGKLIDPHSFDLDHFIPWSFLPHDQLWNLIPGDPVVNIQKSNHLPDLDHYLAGFAKIHHAALNFFLKGNYSGNLLEDYWQLKESPQVLASLPIARFQERMEQVFSPWIQIATNNGFTPNWRYQP